MMFPTDVATTLLETIVAYYNTYYKTHNALTFRLT